VVSHEDTLLALLEKIGQPAGVTAEVAAVEDATSNADHVETSGPSEDPAVRPPGPPKPGIPEGLAPITSKNLFVHHDTHPVVFDVALLARYDLDWLVWEAQTLWKEVKDDFRVPSISDHACTKIQALRTLHINEWFWTKWEVFCWITQALNNNIPDFHVIQKPSIAQLLAAVDISDMVRAGEEFTQEVKGWMAACLVDEGVFYAPNPIAFCQDEVVQLLMELKVEGAEQTIAAVQDRYRQIMALSEDQWQAAKEPILHENVIDVQVAKLKVAADYLAHRRHQLRDQLRLLK
jgi:hypothetical protein